MIAGEEFAARHVAVLGLGKSGLAAARALRHGGTSVVVWDDGEGPRVAARQEGFCVCEPERMDWTSLDALVISPGIAHTFPAPHIAARLARDAGVAVIGDVELLVRSTPQAPIVAITGTNGKSTTTALLGHILKEAGRTVEVGGNLGPPICDMAMLEGDGVYVLELSSYQLELCPTARFKVAILLNITPDHLARHGDMDGYVRAKKHIFHNQGDGDAAIVCVDDDITQAIFKDLDVRQAGKVYRVSTTRAVPHGVYVDADTVIDDLDSRAQAVMALREAVSLPGRHNAQNICAAYAGARLMGVRADEIVRAICSFPGLAHRQEVVARIGAVSFINDSKATNAEAVSKALTCYENIYWIVGGRAKETGLQGLEPLYGRVRKAFLIGEAAQAFSHDLDGRVDFVLSGDLENAVRGAFDAAQADGLGNAVVLLSPACAAFDQFKNFEVRGEAFRTLVEALRGARKVAS